MFASRLRRNHLTILSFLVVSLLTGGLSRAVHFPEIGSTEDQKIPMTIQADTMTYLDRANKVIFDGNVVVVRGPMTMKSKHLEIRLSGRRENRDVVTGTLGLSFDNREIVAMVAEGNVDIRQGAQKAKAAHAVYQKDAGTVELSGNPEAWQGDTYLTGTKITLWLDENRSSVDNGRVVFQPKKNQPLDGTRSRVSGESIGP